MEVDLPTVHPVPDHRTLEATNSVETARRSSLSRPYRDSLSVSGVSHRSLSLGFECQDVWSDTLGGRVPDRYGSVFIETTCVYCDQLLLNLTKCETPVDIFSCPILYRKTNLNLRTSKILEGQKNKIFQCEV